MKIMIFHQKDDEPNRTPSQYWECESASSLHISLLRGTAFIMLAGQEQEQVLKKIQNLLSQEWT